MRFHVAWDSIERENRALKAIITALLSISMLLAFAVMAGYSRPPLVIDRECFTKTVDQTAATYPTDDEMKAFVAVALQSRFNSADYEPAYLTVDQASYRAQEQIELAKQKMKQVVVVNHVEMSTQGLFTVDADRLISVGDVRSTFRFPLTAKIAVTKRSRDNPYGLQLVEVTQVQPEVKK